MHTVEVRNQKGRLCGHIRVSDFVGNSIRIPEIQPSGVPIIHKYPVIYNTSRDVYVTVVDLNSPIFRAPGFTPIAQVE